jgi:hypothetical protein
MKVKENVTVYYCDHCNKKLIVKRAMEKHEQLCYKNPENTRACSGCLFLKEVPVEYLNRYEQTKTVRGFSCEKLNKKLYPFKVEKKGLPEEYPETFEDQEPMPKTCVHYQDFINL